MWLVAAIGVAAGLALWWLTSSGGEPSSPPVVASAPEESRPAPAPAPVAAAPPGAAGGAPPPPPEDPVAAYRARTRYAPGSGRLGEGSVDLLEPNRRYETPRPIEATLGRGADGRVTYLLDVDAFYYTGDEVAEIALRVRRGDEVQPVVIRRAVAIAEDASGPVGEEEPLRFRNTAEDPTAELDLADAFADHHGPIRIEAEFEWEPGQREETSLRIFTTPVVGIPAEFTGRDDDFVQGGSLVVEVGVDVFEPGFYRIEANLFSVASEPVAFGTFKGELAPGRQRVPISFFGLVLHDASTPGPYEVRHLRGYLFRDAAYPDRLRMRDATHTHRTRAWDLAQFSTDEYTSEHKTRMIELLEADVAAGITIPAPLDAAR